MDFKNVISRLTSINCNDPSQVEQLGALIGAIAQSAMGDSAPSSLEKLDSNEVFDELLAVARSQGPEIWPRVLDIEQQTRQENEPTLLMAAVLGGKTEIVRELVAAGAEVNVRIKQFFLFDAMHFAVGAGNLDIIKILIEAGADLNWSDPGFRPLNKAIEMGNLEMLQMLLDAGAEVVFETGFNPLVEAAGKVNNGAMIQLLLNAGCRVNDTNTSNRTALVDACLHGHDEVVRVLLASGADRDRPRTDGLSPLIAVLVAPQMNQALSSWGLTAREEKTLRSRMAAIVQSLAERGAELDVRNFQGKTALMLATEQGNLEIARILIAQGADVNAIEETTGEGGPDFLKNREEEVAERSERKTALHYAAEGGQIDIVAALLDAGVEVAIADKKGRTALDLAIQEGQTEIVRLLENAGAEAPEGAAQRSEAALLGAVKKGNTSILRSALQAGINPNASELQERPTPRYKTALMFAAEGGHLEAVRILLEAGATVNLNDRPGKKLGKTPLMYAAMSDRAEVARFLLEAGATVDAQDKRGQTALFYAVEEKCAEATRVLLEFGADPHKKSWDGTPFEQATYSDGTIIANLVVEADRRKGEATSNAAREEMLRSATSDGNEELVRILVREGTDLNALDEHGWTALMFASAQSALEILRFLLEAGADVNAAGPSGKTALSEAAYWGHLEVVKILIAAGAALNTIELDSGWTPLMKALAFGNKLEVVQALLDAGADPNLRDNSGRTALAIALENQLSAIAQLLRETDART